MSTAADDGRRVYLGCESCGLVSRDVTATTRALVQHCPRCGHVAARDQAVLAAAHVGVHRRRRRPLHPRQRAAGDGDDVGAAARRAHLLGGIHELWLDGSWGLAIIVFIASIAVPVLRSASWRCSPGRCAASPTGAASSGHGCTA
jgi:paraquat-inducible protein A